jgi:hypothetical protein
MKHRKDKCLLQSVQFCFTAFSGFLGDRSADELRMMISAGCTTHLDLSSLLP